MARHLAFVRGLSPAHWYRRNMGMSVDAWVDQIAGANFVQATATNQPSVTAAGSLLFDGVDNFMSATFTLAQPYTIYGLFNQVTWTGTDQIIAGSAAFLRQITTTPQIRFAAGSSLGAMSPVLNTVNVIAMVGNGASSVSQLNNGTPVTGDAGAGAFSNPFLGSSAASTLFANTDNYEWIFYSGAHDAATRQRVIRYLGIVGQLGL